MDSAFEEVLISALDALDSGESVEAISARYPEHAAELQPILLTASSLTGMRIAHSLEAQAASKQRMLASAAAMGRAVDKGTPLLLMLRRLSLVMASLVVVLALLGASVIYASSEAVPGDRLYEAKRLIEDYRVSLTSSTAAKEALQERHEEERRQEITILLRMGRSEEVLFSGIIESISGDVWLVSGLEVLITNGTSFDRAINPAVGQHVDISGVTENGQVRANRVSVRAAGPRPAPTPEPDRALTPDAEPSPTPTATPSATATATATPSPTPSPTDDETPTATTPTKTPVPTATPTLPSNENGNSNDNEGGNSNEDEGGSNNNESGNENEGNENQGNGNENNENGGNDNDDNDNEREENDNDNHNDNDNENNRNDDD